MDSISCSCFVQSLEHCFVEKYIRVVRLYRGMTEHRLDGTGVYRSQHQILMFAPDNPDVPQKELVGMYGVSGATVAVSPKESRKGGYIRRLVDQEDNRCNQICITDKGRKVVEDNVKIFRRIECRTFEGFFGNDMKVLGKLLNRIYGDLNQGFTDRA